jgi:hypothetical protein
MNNKSAAIGPLPEKTDLSAFGKSPEVFDSAGEYVVVKMIRDGSKIAWRVHLDGEKALPLYQVGIEPVKKPQIDNKAKKDEQAI